MAAKQGLLIEKCAMSDAHVFSSRDTSLLGGIQQRTQGRSVKIVVNSFTVSCFTLVGAPVPNTTVLLRLKRDMTDSGLL